MTFLSLIDLKNNFGWLSIPNLIDRFSLNCGCSLLVISPWQFDKNLDEVNFVVKNYGDHALIHLEVTFIYL